MNPGSVDYGRLYDGYWKREDRAGETSGDLRALSQRIAETCGVGRVLDVGSGEGRLVAELLAAGMDAHGLDVAEVVVARANARWHGRFTAGSVLAMPFADNEFDTVVSTDCLEHLSPADVPAALREMRRVTARYAYLQIATTPDRDGHWHLTVEGREWWEKRCIEAGFRKHPLYYRVNPYEGLEDDGWQVAVVLEKVPDAALRLHDLLVLDEERLLHTDMLRETGRRSDAHCIRYHMAAQFVRPGDAVLDVACGLGYGSHIVYNVSQASSVTGVDLSDFGIDYANVHYGQAGAVAFRVGDAQDLTDIPTASIDFVTAFETIEHVPDPRAYLCELRRVLRPGGRLMICAPNDWTDETGRDPNPHHLHVYDWTRLVEQVGESFQVEKGFAQVAGGAMKLHHAPRRWREVSADPGVEHESEWVVLLGMVDPLSGEDAPYSESSWRLPDDAGFHVAAFARDYDNPWLVKGMVSIGMRNSSQALLAGMQDAVMARYPATSVDYGAALCGRAYGLLAQGEVSDEAYSGFLREMEQYAAIARPSPHQLRWQVSLLYAAGELARRRGAWAEAARHYARCAALDVAEYSPLLGNKVLDAQYWLAVHALAEHRGEEAIRLLRRSVAEARRLVGGSWINIAGDMDWPLGFGVAEAAQLMDKASRAAYMLETLRNGIGKAGLVYQEALGYFERQVAGAERERHEFARSCEALAKALSAKESDCLVLADEVRRLGQHVQALGQDLVEQDANAQRLAGEVTAQVDNAKRQASALLAQDARAQALAREVAERDAQAQALAREVAERDAHAQALARQVVERDAHAQALAREVAERDAHAQALAAEVRSCAARIADLEKSEASGQALVASLSADLEAARGEVARLDAEVEKREALLDMVRPWRWRARLSKLFGGKRG